MRFDRDHLRPVRMQLRELASFPVPLTLIRRKCLKPSIAFRTTLVCRCQIVGVLPAIVLLQVPQELILPPGIGMVRVCDMLIACHEQSPVELTHGIEVLGYLIPARSDHARGPGILGVKNFGPCASLISEDLAPRTAGRRILTAHACAGCGIENIVYRLKIPHGRNVGIAVRERA